MLMKAFFGREVGTIMRYLGSYPTEEELMNQVIPRIREDEDSHFIKYDRFEPLMVSVLKEGKYEPDLEDIVLQAFKMVDHERKGYISDYRSLNPPPINPI
jgi:calmodulin